MITLYDVIRSILIEANPTISPKRVEKITAKYETMVQKVCNGHQ